MDIMQAVFRWMHVFVGIIWVGLLYFFNWVNGQFAATLDADTKRKVVPELLPRVLFWFRWGAVWTWFTGLTLLLLVFYHGGLMFDAPRGWSIAAGVMVALTFMVVFLYDALHKSGLGRNPKVFGAVGFLLIGGMLAAMAMWAGFSYRALNIHLGAMFGTAMAFNVWYRIWPAQRSIVTAIKEGQTPDASQVALAGGRSRHNTYMSVPLIWTMINSHTSSMAGGTMGIPAQWAFAILLVVVLVGWHVVFHLYRRAGKLKGF